MRASTIGLGSPRFVAFLAAQFLGAANDNAYKVTLVLLILATVPDEKTQVLYASLASACFPIPFLLFSPIAGYLADRYPKHRVAFWTTAPEIAAMAVALVGFSIGSLPVLLAALLLSATQSAFFSPAKYGLLPEVFDDDRLSMANGVLQLATNLAIVAGSVLGVVVYGAFKDSLVVAGLVYLAVGVVDTVLVAFAPRAPAGSPAARFEWNTLSSSIVDWRETRKSSVLFYTLLGIAWFSFLGSFFLTLIPVYGKNVLGLDEETAGILLAILSIGIGVGSVLAGKLSRGHVEIGLVPLGAVGMSLISFHLALGDPSGWVLPFGVPLITTLDLVALGLFSGFYIVPLNALLQSRAPDGAKGRMIAFSNVLAFAAVLLSAGIPSLLVTAFGLGTSGLILVVATLTVVGTLTVLNIVPDFFVRLVFWLLTNTIYRIQPIGAERIPKSGVLFVANHVSWVDWLLIAGGCDRMIRFLMYRTYYEWSALHWFFRRMGVIPVAAGDPPQKIEESLAIARAQIEAGHAVCIFAEGAITRTGNLLKFKRGFERIAAGAAAPIVPVFLEGVWGSLFSFERGRFFLKRPKRFRAHITVVFGEPMAPTAKAGEVRRAVQELASEAFATRKSRQRPLPAMFVATVRRHWSRRFASDGEETLTFGAALTRALALRHALFPSGVGIGELVGIHLPAGIPATLANLAVALAGRVPVNLDPTENGKWARIAIARAGLRRVLTLERHRGEIEGVEVTTIDEALGRAARASAWTTMLACRLLPGTLPARLFCWGDVRDVDTLATLLFRWPEDALDRPLAVRLTHHNLISNLQSLRQVFDVDPGDVLLGAAPPSHPIGFLATLWLPAVSGAGVVYAADVVDSPELGRRLEGVTILPLTPPLLERVTEHVSPEALRSVRFVATGGADLSEASRAAFQAKFAIEPLEGYGRPEVGAIVSLNVPDFVEGKSRQHGTRPGSTGHPLPGIAVRIVDAETGSALPPGAEGLLEVKGPNVSSGYHADEVATGRAFARGWLRTGERASLDEDGFLTVF